MIRVKRGNEAKKKRKKVLKHTKGFKISNSTLFRVAHQQFLKSANYSYVGRKLRKREFRRGWIIRINCAVREFGMKYSSYISNLKKLSIGLNRKMLSQLASYQYNLTNLLAS